MTYKEFMIARSLGALDADTLLEMARTTNDKRILTTLSGSNDPYVRYQVALNPNTPDKEQKKLEIRNLEVLKKLSKDESQHFRVSTQE